LIGSVEGYHCWNHFLKQYTRNVRSLPVLVWSRCHELTLTQIFLAETSGLAHYIAD